MKKLDCQKYVADKKCSKNPKPCCSCNDKENFVDRSSSVRLSSKFKNRTSGFTVKKYIPVPDEDKSACNELDNKLCWSRHVKKMCPTIWGVKDPKDFEQFTDDEDFTKAALKMKDDSYENYYGEVNKEGEPEGRGIQFNDKFCYAVI